MTSFIQHELRNYEKEDFFPIPVSDTASDTPFSQGKEVQDMIFYYLFFP